MDVDIYSSSFFSHQIHCGHLFFLQNVQIKQFINFSLSVEGTLLKYLYGLKIFVMSMAFLSIYNKRQSLALVDFESFHVSLRPPVPWVPTLLGAVSRRCCSDVGLLGSGSLSPAGCCASQTPLAAAVFSPVPFHC